VPAVILVLIIGFCAIAYVGRGVIDYVQGERTISLFRMPVAGVTYELMRASKELSVNFEAFKKCAAQSRCDVGSILDDRDRIVALAWPAVFDVVSIRGNWFSPPGSRSWRDERLFFMYVNEYGRDQLRNRCVPRVTYYFQRSGDATFNTSGFACGKSPGK
jgi:hypothetical protein